MNKFLNTVLEVIDNKLILLENKKNFNDLDMVRKLRENPFFVCIEYIDENSIKEKIYIGNENIFDDEYNFLVYGIKNPIAELLNYNINSHAKYNISDKSINVKIVNKTFYKIVNSEIIYSYCFNRELNNKNLIKILSNNNTKETHHLIKEIMLEHDKLIRYKNNNLLVHIDSGIIFNIKDRINYLKEKYDIDENEICLIDSEFDYYKIIKNQIDEFKIVTSYVDMYEMIYTNYYISTEKPFTVKKLVANQENEKMALMYKLSNKLFALLDKYIIYLKNNLPIEDIVYTNKFKIEKIELLNYKNKVLNHLPLKYQYDGVFDRLKYLIKRRILDSDYANKLIAENEKKFELNSKKLYIEFFRDNKDKILNFSKNDIEFNILNNHMIDVINSKLRHEDILPYLYFKYKVGFLEPDYNVRQVIINNAEDYSIWQVKILKLCYPDAQFTIIGDKNNRIYKTLEFFENNFFDNYTDIFSDMDQIILNKNFKFTNQINQKIKKLNPEMNLFLKRDGEEVNIIKLDDLKIRSKEIILNIQDTQYKTIGIITKNLYEIKKYFRSKNNHIIDSRKKKIKEGINIIPAYLTKGINFDYIIIFDFDSYNYNEMSLLYLAMTRANEKLDIYYSNKKI